MSAPRSDVRQFVPQGYPPLPKIRTFAVRRPAGVEDVMVDATGVRVDIEGVLVFSEIVYVFNGETGNYEMLRFDRRGFRVWLDYEEIINGTPLLSSTLN